MNEEIRHLIVSGHIAGMQRGVEIAIETIIALVTEVLRPWMKQDPLVQTVDTEGQYDITDTIRLRVAQAIRDLPETCRAVVVLLCKWKFEDTVNYLNRFDLGHRELTIILACSNDQLTTQPKPVVDTSRPVLKLCTEEAPTLPPGLYIVPRVRHPTLMRIESGQMVKYDVTSDRFFVE